ncbi:ataxin-10 isoform X2 [Anoplophora glabripennis]|uniref:ataxin-10 isoform X2 n=1 Tax=Anoplophora glabripennis TaxID=217634 RepID=UPI0008741A3E|nr:ataxin-10 isoform X2 [Anoplophora glabripennis]
MDKKRLFCVAVKETEQIINLNSELITNIKQCNLREFMGHLKDASKIEWINSASPKKISASKEVFNFLDEWLKILANRLQNYDVEVLEAITEILRFLRNCTSNLISQQYILEETIILNTVDLLFSLIIELDVKNICLKVLLQFLTNLVSSNKQTTEKIFILFYERVKKCLQTNINTYESSALIYYISLLQPINDIELIDTVLNLYYNNSENEFLIFFLENSISNDNFWNIYQDIKTENKITILEILKNMEFQKRSYCLPINVQKIFIDEFLKIASTIFYISEKEENKLKAYEVSLLLEILSSLSSNEDYLKKIQRKENDNCFTPIQKLTEFGVNSGLNEHPAFGFKTDLVRLIGNLCWKNEDMQNLARTAELIPVILDCCNMDARNPFIVQWSILAVRNLCDNNEENQKIIASLYQEGTVSSEVLNEMGLTLHSDGGSDLKIVPLESLKKS